MNCKCEYNCPVETTDPVVSREIADIQEQINKAIRHNIKMIKVSDTYMTDMEYSASSSDFDSRLAQEINDRIEADTILAEQIVNETEAREEAIKEAFADVNILVDNEATIRKEEDEKLQKQITGITTNVEDIIDNKIGIAKIPLEERIRELELALAQAEAECTRLWRQEQKRAMDVEENLQKQIYAIEEDMASGGGTGSGGDLPAHDYLLKSQPIELEVGLYDGSETTISEPIITVDPVTGERTVHNDYVRKDIPVAFVETIE